MKPILFTIGSFNVYAFGFFLALALLFSTFIVFEYAKEDLKEEEYFDAFFYTSLIAIIFARIGFILFHFDTFGFNILRYILVRETPGLSLFTGYAGAFIFLYLYSRAYKLPFIHLIDIFAIASSFTLFLAKIGQMLGGAGFGRETDFIFAVQLIGKTGRYHPVELYESILFLFLFIILSYLYRIAAREKWPQGIVGCVFVFSAAVGILLLEFLKIFPVYLYHLSLRQYALVIFIILVIKPTISRLHRIVHMHRQKPL